MSDETRVTQGENTSVVPERVDTEAQFVPEVDIIEKEDSVLVVADMPGVSRDNVDVVLDKGVLTIEGAVEPEGQGDMSLDRREYDSGNFHRCFSVGKGLDAEDVEASMENGVLRLSIPKSEEYRPRKIEIKGQ